MFMVVFLSYNFRPESRGCDDPEKKCCDNSLIFSCTNDNRLKYDYKPLPGLIFYAGVLVVYIVIQIIFFCRMRVNAHAKYQSHFWRYFWQALGMENFLMNQIVNSCIIIWKMN